MAATCGNGYVFDKLLKREKRRVRQTDGRTDGRVSKARNATFIIYQITSVVVQPEDGLSPVTVGEPTHDLGPRHRLTPNRQRQAELIQ